MNELLQRAKGIDVPTWDAPEDANARFVAAARTLLPELTAELERLHTWDGLMSLLDEHWPDDIFPTMADREDRDPGPRIVSLIRTVDQLRALQRDDRDTAIAALETIERLRTLANTMTNEHGMSWNSISGRRIINALTGDTQL